VSGRKKRLKQFKAHSPYKGGHNLQILNDKLKWKSTTYVSESLNMHDIINNAVKKIEENHLSISAQEANNVERVIKVNKLRDKYELELIKMQIENLKRKT